MRQKLETILGKEYRYLAIDTRNREFLTQREMGELLYMSESSYSDIETGVTNCVGALSATVLLSMQDDPTTFLKRVTKQVLELYESEAVLT